MYQSITVNEATYKLLQYLFTLEFINKNFALAGGTSLALLIGHRRSIDLDLFNINKFDTKELEIILSSDKNLQFQYRGNNSRMLFTEINAVKCDFVNEPAKLLDPFLFIDGILYYSIKDIAAMKLHTICGRGKRKDFFDVFCLLQLFCWKDLIAFFLEKYDESQLVFLWKSIKYFEDAELDPAILGFKPYDASWKDIKKFITKTCN